MGLFNWGKGKCVMKRNPFGIDFHCKMKAGEIVINCRLMSAQNSVIILPSYDPRLHRMMDIGYGVQDFMDDIQEIINFIDSNNKGENAFFDAFDVFCAKHIKEYNRLIDTDLFRIIAEFVLIMKATALRNNIGFSDDDRVGITNVFMKRAFTIFADMIYITRYKHGNFGIETYLEKYQK